MKRVLYIIYYYILEKYICVFTLWTRRNNNNIYVRNENRVSLRYQDGRNDVYIGNYNTYMRIRERVRLSGLEIGKSDWISNL